MCEFFPQWGVNGSKKRLGTKQRLQGGEEKEGPSMFRDTGQDPKQLILNRSFVINLAWDEDNLQGGDTCLGNFTVTRNLG